MIRTLIFSVLLMHSLDGVSHDMRMAHYYVYVEDEMVQCDAKIDLEDFKEVLGNELNEENISNFLREHLSIHFDGEAVATELLHFENTEDWVELKLVLKTCNLNPIEVEIFNNILSNEVDNHDNVMRFIFHGRKRIFRLNKDRQQISFSYKRS